MDSYSRRRRDVEVACLLLSARAFVPLAVYVLYASMLLLVASEISNTYQHHYDQALETKP